MVTLKIISFVLVFSLIATSVQIFLEVLMTDITQTFIRIFLIFTVWFIVGLILEILDL